MSDPIGLWMYCIIETQGEMDWDCYGIHGTSRVTTVKGKDFTAVVSAEPMKKYQLVRDYLMAHQKVNEAVMKTHRVLPVRFCTMAEDAEKIFNEALAPNTTEFKSKLAEVAGSDEHGLRVRWKDLDKVFREIGETDEKIIKKKKQILSLPEQQRRTELIDVGHIVQAAVQEKNAKTAQALVDELSPLAVNFKKNNTLGDAMVLNAAFLVKKEKQAAFDERVNALDAKYGEALQFKYVGPVPPFNFVEIVIRWKENSLPLCKRELEGVAPREKHVSIG